MIESQAKDVERDKMIANVEMYKRNENNGNNLNNIKTKLIFIVLSVILKQFI